MNVRTFFLAVVVIPFLSATIVRAQSKSSTPGVPPPNPTPAATSSSSSAIESEMLALGGLDHIATSVAGNVCAIGSIAENSIIVVYDQASFASLQSYEAFVANSRIVATGYRGLIPRDILQRKLKASAEEHLAEHEASAASKTLDQERALDKHLSQLWRKNITDLDASVGIDWFADSTSLLSAITIASNTENASTLSIPDSAMAMALTRELKAAEGCKDKGVAIIYPPLFGKSSSSDYSASDIQAAIQELTDIRKAAHEHVAEHGSKELAADLKDVDGFYDNLINSLIQVNSQTGALGSAQIIQGYRLASLLAGEKSETSEAMPPALVLLASIIAAGGTQHTHKNIWTALWSGDKITYSGGIAVEVGLWKATSKSPIYADVLRYRAPFMNVKDPSDLGGVDSGDNLPTSLKPAK